MNKIENDTGNDTRNDSGSELGKKEQGVKECFGSLEKVFPMGKKGLRETPEDCFFHCPIKTKCLQQAMATKDGTKVEEEIIERSTKAGAMNFFERWSRKKQVHKRKTEK